MDVPRFVFSIILLCLVLSPLRGVANEQADESESTGDVSETQRALERPWQRPWGFGWKLRPDKHQVYWDWEEGLHVATRQEKIRLLVGGRVHADAGIIDINDELDLAFSGLEGEKANLRRAAFTGLATFYDRVDAKLEVDFADVRDIKDNWIGVRRVPVIGYLQFGHQKEPFSLEELAGGNSFTFMERALPTEAFAPRRNLGLMTHSSTSDGRLTWAVGGFWDVGKTSSLEDLTDPKGRIDQAAGFDVTGRITGLPWFEDEGERYLHLGLSYSHRFRDDTDKDAQARFATPPESFLEDVRLVDTDAFFTDAVDLVNPEFALVSGPYSLQWEYFHAFTDADALGDPEFWGFYIYTSWLVTGEHRTYNTSRGTFSRLKPDRSLNLRNGEWGAIELGLRLSHIDLNDEDIKGGRETNFTAGLNWYLGSRVRLMFNYIRAYVDDRVDPQVEDGRAHIFQTRFQFVL